MERSNWARLKECIKKAEEGKELTIGFLGGSITQGSLATTPENTYAYQIFLWWKNTILLDGNFDEDWGTVCIWKRYSIMARRKAIRWKSAFFQMQKKKQLRFISWR